MAFVKLKQFRTSTDGKVRGLETMIGRLTKLLISQ
jgi:hypothetical protein